MSYDFILKQGQDSVERAPDEICRALRALPELAIAEITQLTPLDVDDAVDYLLDSFEESSDAKEQYRAFCNRLGFPDDVDSPDERAAVAFATQALGVDVATVSIPAGTAGDAAQQVLSALARFARANRLLIEDPQLGASVDLDDPGKRPAKR